VEPVETSGSVSPRSANEARVVRLLAVISGVAPMAEAGQLLAPDVICHMDRWTVRGITVWYDWLEFLRWKVKGDVTAELDRLVTREDGTITAYGNLRTANAPCASRQEHQATYRLEDGRIVEVWTTRGNYEMIFGPKVRHPVRWSLVLLEMAIWRRLPWRRRAVIPPRN
jgi:hypothetical protein